jgi:hypothetical protein
MIKDTPETVSIITRERASTEVPQKHGHQEVTEELPIKCGRRREKREEWQ